jgi:DNA invertase Pin-like site-specific DNA recombinase
MIASLAELERETIGDRTRTALGHLKNLGMPVGPAPYGYRTQRSNRLVPLAQKMPLVEDSAEQAVLHEVRGLRAGGVSLREITNWLTATGYKTRRGTEWRFPVRRPHAARE